MSNFWTLIISQFLGHTFLYPCWNFYWKLETSYIVASWVSVSSSTPCYYLLVYLFNIWLHYFHKAYFSLPTIKPLILLLKKVQISMYDSCHKMTIVLVAISDLFLSFHEHNKLFNSASFEPLLRELGQVWSGPQIFNSLLPGESLWSLSRIWCNKVLLLWTTFGWDVPSATGVVKNEKSLCPWSFSLCP